MIDYSFIICARNEADNVVEFLNSVHCLRVPQGCTYEVLMVDDGSSDGTALLARKSMCTELHIVTSAGGGVARSRNLGVKAARGKFLIFCDCDSVLDKNALVEIDRTVHSDDYPDVIQCNIWSQYYRSRLNVYLSKWREVAFKDLIRSSGRELKGFHGRFVAIKKSKLYELSSIGEPFNEKLRGSGGEDLLCGRQAYKIGARIVWAENAVLYHKDPVSMRSILMKRYQAGLADSRAGVAQSVYDRRNFVRTVIKPAKNNVPLWFAFSCWIFYIVGCIKGSAKA